MINPFYGPWIRLSTVLTNAELVADEPFEQDLCGDCDSCIKACPTGALSPYKVDDTKCLVGIHLTGTETSKFEKELKRYDPSFSDNSHLMCTECQKTCKYGLERHISIFR